MILANLLEMTEKQSESIGSSSKYGTGYISLTKFIHSGFKILAVEWLYKNNHNIHKAAWEFNISRKVVREWEKKYNELPRMNVGANSKTRQLNSGRTLLSVELDQ